MTGMELIVVAKGVEAADLAVAMACCASVTSAPK